MKFTQLNTQELESIKGGLIEFLVEGWPDPRLSIKERTIQTQK